MLSLNGSEHVSDVVGRIESPEQAAVREVREEVGLEVQLIRLLSQRPRAMNTGMYYCYLGHVFGGNATLGTDPEFPQNGQQLLACQWFALDDVRTLPEVAVIIPTLLQSAGDRSRPAPHA